MLRRQFCRRRRARDARSRITWGTNLFHYAVFDGTFSHAYAFFLVCVLDVAGGALVGSSRRSALRWPSAPLPRLNVLVRHTNAIFALVLPRTASSAGAISPDARLGSPRSLASARARRAGWQRRRGASARVCRMGSTGGVARQRTCTHGMGFTFLIAASDRRPLQHPEGAVLLVADPAPERGRACSYAQGPGQGVRLACHRGVRASGVAHRELGRMAVRRELRTPRIHRRLCARGAVHRVHLCVGRSAIARTVPLFAAAAAAARRCCRSRR